MDTITISRFLPLVAISIVLLTIKLISPPREVLRIAFAFCWVAGLLNWLVDIVEQHYGFWHYTAAYLIYRVPIDLYFSVSLVVGVNWYSDCGHLEKSGIKNKLLEVSDDNKAKELYEAI